MKHRNRQYVDVAEPQTGQPHRISLQLASQHVRKGVAFWTLDGRLKYRAVNPRQGSDVYVSGYFEIQTVQTKLSQIIGAPRMPVKQWMHRVEA